MQAITLFTLAQHLGPYEKWPRITELFAAGHSTGIRVPGFVIEGQYRCAAGYLLILSQDCPFEESNDFVLLRSDFHLLAQAQLGVPYGSFLLHTHWPESNVTLRLHYFTHLFYRLTILHSATILGTGYELTLSIDDLAQNDPRSQAAVEDLETKLAAIRKGLDKA